MNLEAFLGPAPQRPIRAGLVGVGEFGRSFLTQARRMGTVRAVALCDRDIDRALASATGAGIAAGALSRCHDIAAAVAAVEAGRIAVVDDATLLTALPLDVVIEATGQPEAAAATADAAIAAGKHVVMVTKEAEICVGPILARKARAKGLVHTLVDGDQPSLLVGLVAWARLLGLEIVAAGKAGEHDFVWDQSAGTVTSWGKTVSAPDFKTLWELPEAAPKAALAARLLPGMVSATVPDLCELGIVCNHTGLSPDRPSLHAPVARTLELPRLMRPREEGGILAAAGVVDMVSCLRRSDEISLAGGVFVVVATPDAETAALFAEKGLPTSPDGRHFLIHNPVHLLGAEAPMSVLSACRAGHSTGGLEPRQDIDLVAHATRSLRAGERLEIAERHAIPGLRPELAPARPLGPDAPVPYYLAAGNRLAEDVAEGAPLLCRHIETPAQSVLWRLRREQDATFAKG